MKRQTKFHPGKWTWHHGVLLSLRDRLLRQRAQRRNDAAEPLEPHSLDLADSATDEFDHDVGLSALSASQETLYEVEEAINRIENGTYGFCAATGKPIPVARLKAIPWTRFSRDVELRLERNGQLGVPHLGELRSLRREAHLREPIETNDGDEVPPANDEFLARKIVRRMDVARLVTASRLMAKNG